MIELEHSPLGGSSAKRFMTCAGSFLKHREQLIDGTFEDIPSEFAELGTGAHELGAVCVATDAEPFEFLGEAFNGFRAGWPEEINLDAVQVYVNECRSIMDHCDNDGLAIVEKTYTAPHLHKLLKGTVDFGYLSPSRGVFLRDFKNGEGIGVAAPMNFQLLYYAFLLLIAAEDMGQEHWTPDTSVNLGIVQPNFYGIFEDADVWETTIAFVWDWGHKVLVPAMHDLYNRTMAYTDADFVPGDHCQFCPVLLECPVMRRAYDAYVNASEDFVTMLSNEELDELYAQREYARRFMKVLESTVQARMLTGAKISNAKLVEKQTARVWKPGGAAALQAAFGDRAFKPREILSPAGAEKLSSQGKAIALEYGYKPDSAGLVVAPLSDRRPEAKPRGNATTFEKFAQSPEEAGF